MRLHLPRVDLATPGRVTQLWRKRAVLGVSRFPNADERQSVIHRSFRSADHLYGFLELKVICLVYTN